MFQPFASPGLSIRLRASTYLFPRVLGKLQVRNYEKRYGYRERQRAQQHRSTGLHGSLGTEGVGLRFWAVSEGSTSSLMGLSYFSKCLHVPHSF